MPQMQDSPTKARVWTPHERSFAAHCLTATMLTVKDIVFSLILARVAQARFGSPLGPEDVLIQVSQLTAAVEELRHTPKEQWPTVDEMHQVMSTLSTTPAEVFTRSTR